jgi:hypothetical protein
MGACGAVPESFAPREFASAIRASSRTRRPGVLYVFTSEQMTIKRLDHVHLVS